MYHLDVLRTCFTMLISWSTPLCFAVAVATGERGAIGRTIEETLEEEETGEETGIETKPPKGTVAFTWDDAQKYALQDDVKSGEVLLAYVTMGAAEYALATSERGRFALMVQRAFVNSIANYVAESAGMTFVPQNGFESLATTCGFTYLVDPKERPNKKQFIVSWLIYLVEEAKAAQVNYKDDRLMEHVVKTLESAGETYALKNGFAWPTIKQGARAKDTTAKAFVQIEGKPVQWPGEQADLTAKQPWWEELFEALGVTGFYGFVEYVILTHGTEEMFDKVLERMGSAAEVAHQLDSGRFVQRAQALKASRAIQEKRKAASA